jgi:hypothetical protein
MGSIPGIKKGEKKGKKKESTKYSPTQSTGFVRITQRIDMVFFFFSYSHSHSLPFTLLFLYVCRFKPFLNFTGSALRDTIL